MKYLIELYTDGSCSGNGEKENFGGIGVVLVKDNKVVKEYSKPVFNTTNNRTEMKAVILAIQIAKVLNRNVPQEIIIYSDSIYVVQTVNNWMFNWASKGWKKADKKEPENLDLVQTLYQLMQFERAIKVEKIRGHAGHEFNELADDLATRGTKQAKEEGNELIK